MPLSKIVANSITDNTITTDQIADNSVHGRRNLIINGAMQVHQRGGTTTMNDGQSYSLDRFQGFASAGGTYTITQDSDTPSGEGFTNSLKVAVTSADSSLASGDYYVIDQRIEGNVLAQAAFGTSGAKAVTLSFFVRSSVTGSHGGSLSNSAANRSYPYTYTVSSANTWEYKTITIPGDTAGTWLTTTGIGARLYWGLGAGSTASGPAGAWAAAEYRTAASTVAPISTGSATWYITGAQLEVGSQATPFEYRSVHDELQTCKRFFLRTSPFTFFPIPRWAQDAGRPLAQYSMPVTMRAAPSVSISTAFTDGQAYSGTPLFGDQNTNNFYIMSSQASASANNIYWLRNGVLDISAEL